MTGSNVNASKETGEPNHAGHRGGKSVWWQWTASASGPVTINTFGSSFDTLLAVYTGTSVGSLTAIASNDDSDSLQSQVQFSAVAGTTYRIAVDGWNGASGSITLRVTFSSGLQPVYRLYSDGAPESTHTHLWTLSETERDVLNSWPSWNYEGIAWYSYLNNFSGGVPLYRLYEPNIKRHLYTMDTTEYEVLGRKTWEREGIQYYVYANNALAGTVPAYRFYNASNKNHHFTIDENEKNHIIANPKMGYAYESIAFYVYSQARTSSLFVDDTPNPKSYTKNVVTDTAIDNDVINGNEVTSAQPTSKVLDIRYDSEKGFWYILCETELIELTNVPGDYNGDGIEDTALYEESSGNWYVAFAEADDSSSLSFNEPIQLGGSGFMPVPGDFNNDGVSDLAVYHEETGICFIMTIDGDVLVWGREVDKSVLCE
ncbi:MAG: hypothetical protein GX811_02265 [Lentisphaerae bacterium]|nr:hypothetical protein [Lentisphaerota bacterium]